MNKKILVPFLLLGFLFALPFSTFAQESITKLDDIEGRQNINDNYEIEISNGDEKSSLKLYAHANQIHNQEEYFQQFTQIYHWSNGESTFLLLEQRTQGSGSALKFSLYELENGKATLLQTSKDYLKGNLVISDNATLEVSYPKYKETDNMATPSQIMKDIYSFENKEFVLTDTVDVTNKVNEDGNDNSYSFYSYNADVTGVNPSAAVINELLTKKAIENGIPPEVLKAIAWQESGWQQFRINNGFNWDKNDVVIGFDGLGIGIMQISIRNLPLEKELLYKTSIEANIDKGIEILLEKWNYGGRTDGKNLLIPTINDNNKEIIENWYFAIMAYNGMGVVNNPIGTKYKPYQDLIYEHIKDFGAFDVTPFPKEILQGEVTEGNRLYFKSSNYKTNGPLHKTTHKYSNDVVTLSQNNVPLTTSVDGSTNQLLSKGTILQIVGPAEYSTDRLKHYATYPVKMLYNPNTFYIRSSALKDTDMSELELLKTDISGYDRYSTSAAISNTGWKTTSDVVVLGRGDISVDALTGSVLAKKFNAPLLLTQNESLPYTVNKELARLSPKTIYILGGENAISKKQEQELKEKYSQVIRLNGQTRHETAIKVASLIGTPSELMIATDNENSPDSLAIGPVAATKQAPILLSSKDGLTKETRDYIKRSGIKKIYLIGAEQAVPAIVINQLKSLGISNSNIVRVAGSDRYRTSIEIINHFKLNTDNIVFSNGDKFIDALPGTPFAAKMNAPIVLTQHETTPWVVSSFLQNKSSFPNIYFLGGENAISSLNRLNIIDLAIKE